MKNVFIRLALVALAVAALAGCKGRGQREGEPQDVVAYNPFVDQFTSGRISRFAPVYLVLNEDIPEEKRTQADLDKNLKITPEVAGSFQLEDANRIVFRPATEFRRNTQYTITANIGAWFGTEREYREFSFPFATLPLSLRASFESIYVSPTGDGSFDVVCAVQTPDKEEDATVESLVLFSERVTASWEHGSEGRRHKVTISAIQPGDSKRTLDLVAAPNKLGVDEGTILSVNIPGRNDFTVYSVNYVTEPQRFVEVTFTEELDPDQNLTGIAYIEDNTSEMFGIEANRLRLYPDSGREGVMNVILGAAIRSRSGIRLGEDMVRQVTVSTLLPQVRFARGGNIIPVTEGLSVPFQAVNLSGVIVDIVRIYENNVGNFFQSNTLDGQESLVRVGTPVTSKVIYFEEENLSQWNTYSLELGEIMKPEPGAIYQVSLRFNRDLSVYPCAEYTPRSREVVQTEADEKFRQKKSAFDRGEYYYEQYDWYNYNYYDRNNPCTSSYSGYRSSVSTNIVATNLGVVAKMGEGGRMLVSVHNLLTAMPERGVNVSVYNYQNRPLGKAVTNERGRADIETGEGIPFYLVASAGNQRTYMRVDRGTSMSMSSFDVSGSTVQKGIKGFIYGERGVWRPGDTLHMVFMLNDRTKTLPANHPVTMELYNPLGQLYLTKTQTRNELGLYTFDMPTNEDAPTGAWNIKVAVGGASFDKAVRIETIKPNRLKIEMGVGTRTLSSGEPVDIPMHIEWLQGARARNMNYEVFASFSPAQTRFDGFADFDFDDPSKSVDREEMLFAEGQTDENGDVILREKLETDNSAPGMLNVNFVTRVYEESGDFSIDARTVRYSPYDSYVGIRSPQVGRRQLNTGMSHIFDVAAVDAEGNPVKDAQLNVTVYKIRYYWWWSSGESNLANFMSNSHNKPVRTFNLTTKANGQASFNLNFGNSEWGTYFVQVESGSGGHSTGVMAYFDWPSMTDRSESEGADGATQLSFTTDTDEYEPGDKMRVTFPSTEGARAMVSIENGTKVLTLSEFACTDEETTVELDVTADMQPNAYVHITLLQPYGVTQNDMPIRLYGVKGVTVTSPESYLYPVIKMADEVKPEAEYSVTVSEKSGRQMSYTLAIVDEGLLDLTHFPTPNPWNAFNAKEALGVRTWDMYNQVMGAYGGRIEQMFSIGGGDEASSQGKASTNRFRPVVQFEGPFILKKGESKTHKFRMPNYTGRVRVMVVAGDGTAYGNAEKSVMVRKPVMLLGTLPRVIGVNEEMVVPATVFATEPGIGAVRVSIKTSDNMTLKSPDTYQLDFDETGDKMAMFYIAVGGKPGKGRVTITASSRGDHAVYDTEIEIRSVTTPQTKVTALTLEAGKSWDGKVPTFGLDGTNKMTLEVSDVQPVNLSQRVGYLLGYPHGCIEQITSKGFPQLYLKEFTLLTPSQAAVTEEAVKQVINRMRSYQTPAGAFSYWPGGSNIYGWATVYATHFLLEAEGKGYLVPSSLKNNSLNDLRRTARAWRGEKNSFTRSEQMTQAYRLWVLAMSGNPETGAMNRLRETDGLSDMAVWMLAAAYAGTGRDDVAQELVSRTREVEGNYNQYDTTFGSNLRDKAIKLMVLTMLGRDADAARTANEISAELSSEKWLSTQTTAYALMGMSRYFDKFHSSSEMNFSYTCGTKKGSPKTTQNLWSEVMFEGAERDHKLSVRNNGASTLFVRLIVEGVPEHGKEEAYANGLALTVNYLDASGDPISVDRLDQGTAFTAEVTVANTSSSSYRNIILSQIFPSGWEILNTRFLNEDSEDEGNPSGVSYQDFRDDRVYSYIDYLPSGYSVKVQINLAAIYPGHFHMPPVEASAMYDNTIRANTAGTQVKVE